VWSVSGGVGGLAGCDVAMVGQGLWTGLVGGRGNY